MKRFAIVLFLILFHSPLWSGNQVSWFRSFDQALHEARRSSRPIFVDAFADWCLWCHKLDKEVYADPRFVKFMEKFVPVKMDVEDNAEGTRFAGRYQIEGLPTLLVLDSEGKITNRIDGFLPVEDLIADLSSIQQLVKLEKEDSSNTEASYRLAREYVSREMYREAEVRFQKVLSSPDSTAEQKESSQFLIALCQFYEDRLNEAVTSLEKYQIDYPGGKSEEDTLLLLSEIYLQMDSKEKAGHYLQEFLHKYPNSGNVERAKHVLSLLEHKQETNPH